MNPNKENFRSRIPVRVKVNKKSRPPLNTISNKQQKVENLAGPSRPSNTEQLDRGFKIYKDSASGERRNSTIKLLVKPDDFAEASSDHKSDKVDYLNVYVEENLKHLLETERKCGTVPVMKSSWRSSLINWMVNFNGIINGSPLVIHLACYYLDYYLRTKFVAVKGLQVVAAACFWVAAKYEGTHVYGNELVEFSSNAFSKKELQETEWRVLQMLKFPTPPVTPDEFIYYLSWCCDQSRSGVVEAASAFLCQCGVLTNKSYHLEYPSVVAAAAVKTAVVLLKKNVWLEELTKNPILDSTLNEAVWTDPRTSRAVSDIFRALVVIFFVLIYRVRFSNRREDGIKANTAARVGGVVTVFVAIFFGVIAFLNCSTGDIAGMKTGGTAGGQWQQPQCSWECRCNPANYGFTPVCVVDTGITHFSPCSAGCNDYENLNGLVFFHNCSCGEDHRVVRRSCMLPSCQAAFSAYIIIFTIMIAVCVAAMLMQGMVVLRAVQRWDKAFAQGLAFSTITLLAHVPGHLLYMSISYLTCAYKSENYAAECTFHRPTIYWAAISSSVLSLCSAIVSFISSRANRKSGGITFLGSTVSLDSRN